MTGPVAELSARLRAAKEDTGLSYKQIERAVYDLLGTDSPTHETIRAYHKGDIREDRVNERLVVALCRVYNRPVAEFAPFVAERIEVLKSLLDQEEPTNSCADGTAVQAHLFEYARMLEADVEHPVAA